MNTRMRENHEVYTVQATHHSHEMLLNEHALVSSDAGHDGLLDVGSAAIDSAREPDLSAELGTYLSALPAGFGCILPAELSEQIATARPFILDVRETSEVTISGAIADSVNIPIREVARNLARLPDKDQPIVAVCSRGHRAALTMMALQMMGYTNVKSLVGGFAAWSAASLPVVK